MEMKKIGFTGTRKGLTTKQKDILFLVFESKLDEYDTLIHGDCVGADVEAHKVALQFGFDIYGRPCNLNEQRAFAVEKCLSEPKAPLVRNQDIVNDVDFLIACPGTDEEELRSGTWSTIRYARKKHKPMIIIFPDGKFRVEFSDGSFRVESHYE